MKHLTPALHAQSASWLLTAKRTLICLALLLPLGALPGCSSDDSEGEGPAPTTEPNTVQVSASTGRMPGRGVLKSEFADSPKGCGIAAIVDNNNTTKFSTPHAQSSIFWEGDAGVAINYYSLTSADDKPECDPKSWTLYGSNDNTTWQKLDARTEHTFASRKQKKEFDLDNTTGYRYLRLTIEANNGGASTQIAELSIKKVRMDINDLMQYAIGSSYDPNNPMGKHHARDKQMTTSEEDRKWLADASKEPNLFGNFTQWKAFPVSLYPTAGKPSPADVNQHGVGDCCAMAVFASFAYIYPDFIQAIITDNGNSTYTVDMFDPSGEEIKVTVSNKFLADGNGTIQAGTGKNNIACWSTILEKAMIKWNQMYQKSSDVGGIGTEYVVPLFTGDGDSFAFDRGKLNNEQLARAVRISLQQGKIVVGGFSPGDVPIEGLGPGGVTISAHAYTLMISPKDLALFIMRNPWGGHPGLDNSADGAINIPDNLDIPPLIDLRIVNPGKAAEYGSGTKDPYTPPAFAPGTMGMRVSPDLMRSGR